MQNTTNLAGECEELAPIPPFLFYRGLLVLTVEQF